MGIYTVRNTYTAGGKAVYFLLESRREHGTSFHPVSANLCHHLNLLFPAISLPRLQLGTLCAVSGMIEGRILEACALKLGDDGVEP